MYAQKHEINIHSNPPMSKGKIYTSLKKQFKLGELAEKSFVGLPKAYGGTQTASI